MSKYLKFTHREGSKKNIVVDIESKKGDELGVLRYDHYWRKFVFEPKHATYYDTICLMEISNYLKEMDNSISKLDQHGFR